MNVWQICLALMLTAVVRAEWRVTPLAELEHIPIAAGFTEQWAQVVCAETTRDWGALNRLRAGETECQVATITCTDHSQVRTLTVPFSFGGDLSPMGTYFLMIIDDAWGYSTANGEYQTIQGRFHGYTWSADDRWLALAEHGDPGSYVDDFSVIDLPAGTRTRVGTPGGAGNVRFQGEDALVVDDMIWRRNAEGEWENEGKVALLAGIQHYYGLMDGAGLRFIFPRDVFLTSEDLAFVDLGKGTRREALELNWSRYRGAYEADGGGTVALRFGALREGVFVSRIAIWDVETLRERTSFELVSPEMREGYGGTIDPIPAFSPDGALIAVNGQDKLWNTADGSVAVQLPGRAVISGATSFGHGNRLVVRIEGEKAKLIKIEKVEVEVDE